MRLRQFPATYSLRRAIAGGHPRLALELLADELGRTSSRLTKGSPLSCFSAPERPTPDRQASIAVHALGGRQSTPPASALTQALQGWSGWDGFFPGGHGEHAVVEEQPANKNRSPTKTRQSRRLINSPQCGLVNASASGASRGANVVKVLCSVRRVHCPVDRHQIVE